MMWRGGWWDLNKLREWCRTLFIEAVYYWMLNYFKISLQFFMTLSFIVHRAVFTLLNSMGTMVLKATGQNLRVAKEFRSIFGLGNGPQTTNFQTVTFQTQFSRPPSFQTMYLSRLSFFPTRANFSNFPDLSSRLSRLILFLKLFLIS